MSWTYSKDPANNEIDKCRFFIGDTNQSKPLMQDEEIQFIIDTYPGENNLLYQLFTRAAVLYARDVKRSLGDQSEDPTERIKFFERQATLYRTKMVSGGISIPNYSHEKIFHVGMQNNPPYPGGADNV
jgi:hypothetical protein